VIQQLNIRNHVPILLDLKEPNYSQWRCWWKSGPKGGRRHNSPLSSLPPFACFHKATTSTCARGGNAKLNRTVKETRKYSEDRRPKDQQMPSALSSHYSVSVSLQGVHYL
jgi:hypothetical protein